MNVHRPLLRISGMVKVSRTAQLNVGSSSVVGTLLTILYVIRAVLSREAAGDDFSLPEWLWRYCGNCVAFLLLA